MIKFAATTKDGLLLGLGITQFNVDKLKAGAPMHIKLREMFVNDQTGIGSILGEAEIMIFYGEDEDSMQAELQRTVRAAHPGHRPPQGQAMSQPPRNMMTTPTTEEAEALAPIIDELAAGLAAGYSRGWVRRRLRWMIEILEGSRQPPGDTEPS
jgi:hypothetical protein